ncbi:MAG TPA: hypothetical protein VFP37_15205 [Steroidobacteraceae bacterium]|nr:hypothetical protein [Steroidobacteraceae bacterium]
MNERNRNDESAVPDDPVPASDPEPTPRYPKRSKRQHDARPETLANNTKVTPLDEDNNLKDGIEIDER